MNVTRGVVAYLLLAFGLAWGLWAIALRAVPASPRDPLFQLLLLPGGFAPALAAAIVRRWITREGFADAGLRPHLRRGWRLYLFALVWPLFVVAAIAALAAALGASRPDFSLRRALGTLAPGQAVPDLPSALWLVLPLQVLASAVVATPILWGEEFGWRGYLQRHLLPGRPLAAAVLTGLLWGVWHYPLILRGYQYPDDRLLGLAFFPVSTILLSIIFGWLQTRTGSVWAPSLAHAATNTVGGSLTLLLFLGGPNWPLVGYVGALGWLPLGALCAWIVLRGGLSPAATGAQPPRESTARGAA